MCVNLPGMWSQKKGFFKNEMIHSIELFPFWCCSYYFIPFIAKRRPDKNLWFIFQLKNFAEPFDGVTNLWTYKSREKQTKIFWNFDQKSINEINTLNNDNNKNIHSIWRDIPQISTEIVKQQKYFFFHNSENVRIFFHFKYFICLSIDMKHA